MANKLNNVCKRTNFKSQKTIILIVTVLFLVFVAPAYSSTSNYDRTYTFYVQYGNHRFSHRLYVSVPPSLYDYYRSKTHSLYSGSHFSKFVTPDAVKSIAEIIHNVTRNAPYSDEQFANIVLKLVHQISYVKSDAKYPAEAIVDNSGDCDVLSYLAASIMKAGGLDVVLLHYKESIPTHMNVGVYLPNTPVYARKLWKTPKGYEYDGKKYWVAECTSRGDWKVGDQPSKFVSDKAQIISLENCEKTSPAHVSASLDSPLTSSSISIDLNPEPSNIEERAQTLKISGLISPAYSGQSVVMYVTKDGSSYKTFRTVFTDKFGNYSLTWNFTSTGTYYIRTSWSGVSNYGGSDSETITVFVGFHQPLVQLEAPEYYWGAGIGYTSARASAAAHNILVSQGVQEFLEINLSGEGVFLSGEFIILRSEGPVARSEKTITILSHEQTTKKHLCFMLRHDGGNNYSASVRVVDDYDISQTKKLLHGNNTAFINISMDTRENTWYEVLAKMSKDEITAELRDKNGTLLKSVANRDDAISISEFGILIAYNRDTVITFRNLKIETIDKPTQPIESNNIQVNRLEWRRGG